jgi:hypothetical protein
MRVEIGGVGYELVLVQRDLLHPRDGGRCRGLTWPDRALIEVDGRLPPEVRRKVVWHELGHAFKAELDVSAALQLPEEMFCDLVALALTRLSPKLYARLWLFATRGYEAADVIMIPGLPEPIPVIRYRDPSTAHGTA